MDVEEGAGATDSRPEKAGKQAKQTGNPRHPEKSKRSSCTIDEPQGHVRDNIPTATRDGSPLRSSSILMTVSMAIKRKIQHQQQFANIVCRGMQHFQLPYVPMFAFFFPRHI